MNQPFRLDRKAFSLNTFDSASHQRAYWLSKTPAERLAAAWYLVCAAWNLDISAANRLDRTYFTIRKQEGNAPKNI